MEEEEDQVDVKLIKKEAQIEKSLIKKSIIIFIFILIIMNQNMAD